MQCGNGWLIAEPLGGNSVRWALDAKTSLSFGRDWARTAAPLITAYGGTAPRDLGDIVSSESIRPTEKDPGDREIEIHHELDGPLQGFGKRLWESIRGSHPATETLLTDIDDRIVDINY